MPENTAPQDTAPEDPVPDEDQSLASTPGRDEQGSAEAAPSHGPIFLEAPHVTPCVSSEQADSASVLVSCRLRNGDGEVREGVLSATLRDTGQVVEREFRLAADDHNQAALPELRVMFPHLWEPLRGEPGSSPRALYSIDLEVVVHGVLSDRRRVRFGIRDVALVEGEDRPPALQVNGALLDLEEGASVALWDGPEPEVEEGGDPDHRHHGAVAELAERGVSLLRVPWGDLDDRASLLSACDEHGIPVAMALWPAESPPVADSDPPPHERLVEAREAMRRLRNHPSLVLWLGGVDEGPPEDLDSCLRCYVTGEDRDGNPCRFAGESPCGHEGVLDGARPYRSHPGGLLPPSR